MSQELNPLPWGAQDRFQAHYIVKTNGHVTSDEFLAKSSLTTEGHFAKKRVVGVEWYGGDLAQVLNSDEDLKKMILKLSYRDAQIWVEPTRSGIRIHGRWKGSYELQISKDLFEVYDRIAYDIKRKLGLPPIES